MRTRRLPLVLLCCAAASLAGCGSSSLLDGGSASELRKSLSTVQTAIDDGRCAEARSAAREGARKVGELPTSVDAELRSSLRTGFEDLTSRVASDCKDATTAPATTVTTETTESVAPTAPPTTDAPTDSTPVDPGTTESEPTDPPTTDQVEPTDPPGNGGGLGNDDGGGDDSGGVVPGVDGPAAGERAVPRQKDVVKDAAKRRKSAEKAVRGQGAG